MSRGVPRLEFGDRLSREEFERRYAAMPNLRKAELIDGMVYLQPAVDDDDQTQPRANLGLWLGQYTSYTDGVEMSQGQSIRLDPFSEPQPDALLRILPTHGGQTVTAADGVVEGAPEWIGEIASSTASYDLHDKLEAYRRAGVIEYCVWTIHEQQVLWFRLDDGDYELLKADDDGIHRSRVFPGLWLDARALLAGAMGHVLRTARRGLGTLEHASFVLKLETTADDRRRG
ncbi:MAG: Uma2 family endonuclease [Planctomycetes bacterium]|nr:Uma2 family endonuclease [Planctomycetota bacterium]